MRSRQPYFEPDEWRPEPLPSGSLNPPGRKPPTALATATPNPPSPEYHPTRYGHGFTRLERIARRHRVRWRGDRVGRRSRRPRDHRVRDDVRRRSSHRATIDEGAEHFQNREARSATTQRRLTTATTTA